MTIARDPLRPQTLKEYIGQDRIKEVLHTAILAAKERNEPLDHVLLNGPPGLGKTTLANIIAKEMGWKIKATIGTAIGTGSFTRFLLVQKPKTILFIDEVHRMRRPIQELFYPVLEDNTTPEAIRLPPLTIIGATTQMGKLEQPFIDRFPLPFQLDYYGEEDLAIIVEHSAAKLKVRGLLNSGITTIADRGRGTPRIANNLLRRVRDFIQVTGKEADETFVTEILWGKMGIDGFGLDRTDRQYLQILQGYPDGVGVDTIATTMNQSVETLEDFIEPYLLRLGFIERRRSGRVITELGTGHLNEIARGRRVQV